MVRFIIFVCLFYTSLSAQEVNPHLLQFEEYLGMVKQFHPVAQQGQLQVELGEANLLKARGAFDPKIEVDYDRKKFKNTEYFDKLSTVFKIPTWYGIELKGKWDRNSGEYLNPEAGLPADGLYSAGISFSLADGLWINDRMAQLKKAKVYREQTRSEQIIILNNLLFEASIAYFEWSKAYQEVAIYEDFYDNAQIRLEGVIKSIEVGDKAAIDSTEAKVTVQNRKLDLYEARLALTKSQLIVSNFLWLENQIPIELQPDAHPEVLEKFKVYELLLGERRNDGPIDLENHPKIQLLRSKAEQLTIEKRLRINKLLPDVSLEYNFYSEDPDAINSFNTANYYAGLNIRVPLFLRKERGELNMARLKLSEVEFDIIGNRLSLSNKIKGSEAEIDAYVEQLEVMEEMVLNYEALVKAEERRFGMGESSLFLVNSREQQLIASKIKRNDLNNKLFRAQAKLFESLGLDLAQN